jgi:hypothetical protein
MSITGLRCVQPGGWAIQWDVRIPLGPLSPIVPLPTASCASCRTKLHTAAEAEWHQRMCRPSVAPGRISPPYFADPQATHGIYHPSTAPQALPAQPMALIPSSSVTYPGAHHGYGLDPAGRRTQALAPAPAERPAFQCVWCRYDARSPQQLATHQRDWCLVLPSSRNYDATARVLADGQVWIICGQCSASLPARDLVVHRENCRPVYG